MDSTQLYTSENTCSLVQEANSSYLYQTKVPTIATPLNGPTMGLMMLISTLQYQAPYMNPTYSQAAQQAGKAAFVTSGGQAMQDKATVMVSKSAIDFGHSLGLTDIEMGILGGSARAIRDKQIKVNGPRFGQIKSTLTANPTGGTIGFKYEW